MGTRAAAHEDHKASNKLWTFYLALLAHTVTERFEVKRFLNNRLPRWDGVENVFKDADVSDVAMSIITWSFWLLCGLNPSPVAGGGAGKRHAKHNAIWIKKNMRRIYEDDPQGLFLTNLNKYEEMLKKVQATEDARDRKHGLHKDLWSEKQHMVEKTQKRKALVARIRAAVALLQIEHDYDGCEKISRGELAWEEVLL